MNWIELHTDTRYSETLSFQSIERMIAACAANGCAAVAITDRNTVQGYLIAEKETQKHGIGLIYGLTLDCVDREDRYEVTLLAKNLEGRRISLLCSVFLAIRITLWGGMSHVSR